MMQIRSCNCKFIYKMVDTALGSVNEHKNFDVVVTSDLKVLRQCFVAYSKLTKCWVLFYVIWNI